HVPAGPRHGETVESAFRESMDVNLDLWARHVRTASDPPRLSPSQAAAVSERLELGRQAYLVNLNDGLFHRMPTRNAGA
ncbi:hypothetical protein, partial [Azospirillum sp. B506]|uniref:hypothetical protein n=1 Tax=Azospirillum sp. B506 TaxID=137721 RepID=UPI001B3B6BD9